MKFYKQNSTVNETEKLNQNKVKFYKHNDLLTIIIHARFHEIKYKIFYKEQRQ